jgi:uncharacterized SAM-binding protein YcdF (DUF218 family)
MKIAGGRSGRRQVWVVAVLSVAFLALAGANAGKILVVDDPQPSDVILVLEGETEQRPARSLQLLQQGYGRRVVLDVHASEKIYNFTRGDLAKKYVESLPQAAAVSICATEGLSTKAEARDAEKCLGEDVKRVLLVTSDFHTRRALSIFRHELRGRSFSVAAARDSTQYGERWWAHRQWAKTFVDEWLRVVWWHVVDQWK